MPTSVKTREKMKLIDTHAHLYSRKFQNDIDTVIERAKEICAAIYLPNIDIPSIQPMLDLQAKDPDFFHVAMGLHPCSVKEGFETILSEMKTHLDGGGYVAIGETGLDLYWDKTFFEQQKASLQTQIDWAKAYQLPIILHCREAMDHVIDMIEANLDENLSGIFHCFDGSIEQARRIMEFNSFQMGIGGPVTYRKDVQAMVKEVDLDYLVLETDSPYLPPAPHRKDKPRRNEPGYTKYMCTTIAELQGKTYEEIAEITSRNARKVFQAVEV